MCALPKENYILLSFTAKHLFTFFVFWVFVLVFFVQQHLQACFSEITAVLPHPTELAMDKRIAWAVGILAYLCNPGLGGPANDIARL